MVESRVALLAEKGGDRGIFLDEIRSPLSRLIVDSHDVSVRAGNNRANDVLTNVVLAFHQMPWLEPIPVERFVDGTRDGLLTCKHLSQILTWRNEISGYIEMRDLQLMQQVVEDLMPGRIPAEAVNSDLSYFLDQVKLYYAERAKVLGGGVWRHELSQGIESYYKSEGTSDSKVVDTQAEQMDRALDGEVFYNISFYDQEDFIDVSEVKAILITPKGIETMLTWDHFPRDKYVEGIGPENLAVLKKVLEELAVEKGIELTGKYL